MTDQDELLILEEGIRSSFWKLMNDKWTKFNDLALSQLLSPTYNNKEFLAGKIKGQKALLEYPEVRIKTLKDKAVINGR
jgi:hypothetical protein